MLGHREVIGKSSESHLIPYLADETELSRLTSMGVIQREADYDGVAEKSHQLSTKFVRDWRLKQFGDASRVSQHSFVAAGW